MFFSAATSRTLNTAGGAQQQGRNGGRGDMG